MSSLNAINGSDLSVMGPAGPGGRRGPDAAAMAQRLWGAAGLKTHPDVKSVYTVDRTVLRSLLMCNIEEHIKFGKVFTRYETAGTGVTAFFADGTCTEGSLLVGAEGVTSAVRKQLLPNHRYVDTGARALYGKTPITAELVARFPAAVLGGGMSIIQHPTDKLGVFLEPIRFPGDVLVDSDARLPKIDDYVYWVFGGGAEAVGMLDEEFRALLGQSAVDATLKLTQSWDPSLKVLFELQSVDQCAPLRLLSAKPRKPEWAQSPNVTLLGDAAHAMLPAGGSGAGCALADAALLLKLIVEMGVSEDSLTKYVDEMWLYALPCIEGSAMGGKKLLGFNGFEGLKEVEL